MTSGTDDRTDLNQLRGQLQELARQAAALQDQLSGQVEALARQVAAIEARSATVEGAADTMAQTVTGISEPQADTGSPKSGEAIGRRHVLRALGTAAAAGTGLIAGSAVLGATPAAANHTEGFGHTNDTGADGTNVRLNSGATGIDLWQSGAGGGISTYLFSTQNTSPAVEGRTYGRGSGVYARSTYGPGLQGSSGESNAVQGTIDYTGNGFNGVYGTTVGSGNGVFGETTGAGGGSAVLGIASGPGNSVFGYKAPGIAGDAIVGVARTGRGMSAISDTGIGVQAQGGRAPLLLIAAGTVGAPTTGAHVKGEMFTDSTGALWSCVTDGTPGTWRKLAGPTTAGALHVLPVPVRVYDSRPGTLPAVGSKTPLSPASPRVLDLKANNSTVPAGATAAVVTVLLVNATAGSGNFTIWANGVTKPLSNTMVWGGNAARFSTQALTAVDTQAQVLVQPSLTTDLVLDVIGYYR